MKSLSLALALAVSVAWVTASGQTAVPHPVPPQSTVLVELFTSEGCSSCPPADALLKKLDGTRTDEGTLIVGISEHVTYWNQLGWADPFSQNLFTERQNAYGARFALDSVYTPQIVVNGEREVLGSDGRAVLKAVGSVERPAPLTLRIESAVSSGKTATVTYTVTGEASGADLFAVVADNATTSSVVRGENAGRTLSHVSVARSLTRIGRIDAAGTHTLSVTLPDELKGHPGAARHLILFVQARGLGRVLAVDSRGL